MSESKDKNKGDAKKPLQVGVKTGHDFAGQIGDPRPGEQLGKLARHQAQQELVSLRTSPLAGRRARCRLRRRVILRGWHGRGWRPGSICRCGASALGNALGKAFDGLADEFFKFVGHAAQVVFELRPILNGDPLGILHQGIDLADELLHQRARQAPSAGNFFIVGIHAVGKPFPPPVPNIVINAPEARLF